MSREVVLVAYGRSPMCRARKGSFATTHPVDYAAQTLKGVLAKVPQLDPSEIGDVIVGCATIDKHTEMNIARLTVLRAGLPESVCGQTVCRFCSSGLQTIATAANAIANGEEDVIVAGGVEAMTLTFGAYPDEYMNKWLVENVPGAYMTMGETAENVVKRYGITRQDMDQMACDSHAKAAKAQAEGKLAPSIIPVTVIDENGNEKVCTLDEGIRPSTNMETLANLKTCFIPEEEGGTVTAATSSQTTDGAAFAVLMSREKAEALGIKPIAKFVGFNVAGCDPTEMGVGPAYAVPKLMKRIGMTVDDMDVIEINEAFASQSLYCIRKLGMDMNKVNPYGGAMALGHPMGATGAFLLCKALDYLQDNNGKYALITMCIGGGMGAAGVFELL